MVAEGSGSGGGGGGRASNFCTRPAMVCSSDPNDESAVVFHDSRPENLSRSCSRSSLIPSKYLLVASAFTAMKNSTFVGFIFGARASHHGDEKNLAENQPALSTNCDELR